MQFRQCNGRPNAQDAVVNLDMHETLKKIESSKKIKNFKFVETAILQLLYWAAAKAKEKQIKKILIN